MSINKRIKQYEHCRLIRIEPEGLVIDPSAIAVMTCVANYQARRHTGRDCKAILEIETRGGRIHKLGCIDVQGAEKLRDGIVLMAIRRGKPAPRTANGTDHTGRPMPGDPEYAELQ